MSRILLKCTLLVLCCALGLDGARAYAEVQDGVMKRLEGTDPVRRRQMMRKGRTEFGLSLGSSTGELYQTTALGGLQINHYFTDGFGMGLYGFYGLNFESSLAEKVKATRPDRLTEDSFAGVGVGASLDVIIVPAYGKASLLGVINGKYDLNVTLGAGAIQVTGNEALAKFAIAPSIGIGSRFFFNEFFAINLQLKDYVYQRAQNAIAIKDVMGQPLPPLVEETWMNHFFVTATFCIFLGKPQISR